MKHNEGTKTPARYAKTQNKIGKQHQKQIKTDWEKGLESST